MSLRAHRRPVLAVTSLLGGIALCAACGTAYSQADVPSDGGPEAQVGEGGDAPASEASTNDAPGNGPSLDASPPSKCEILRGDSSADDFFCTDFDDAVLNTSGVPSGWTDLTANTGTGKLSLQDDAGIDASRALDVFATTGAAGSADTRLRVVLSGKNDASGYAHYQLDFDFRVLASTLDYAALGLLVFAPQANGQHGIAAYAAGSRTELSHQTSGSPPVKLVTNDNPTTWHHARITLDRAAAGVSTYERTITIDSVDVDDDPSGHTIETNDSTELWIGLFDTNLSPGNAHAQFDNVVLRRRLK